MSGMRLGVIAALLLLSACSVGKEEPVTAENFCVKGARLLGMRGLNAHEKQYVYETMRSRGCMGQVAESYPGNCEHDWNTDAAGNRCGDRSAWSRPGGY